MSLSAPLSPCQCTLDLYSITVLQRGPAPRRRMVSAAAIKGFKACSGSHLKAHRVVKWPYAGDKVLRGDGPCVTQGQPGDGRVVS